MALRILQSLSASQVTSTENNLLTEDDIKEIKPFVREIAADNMLPGSTDMEVEFTTRDCDPLVPGITSYGIVWIS